jgi:hypothetical protein
MKGKFNNTVIIMMGCSGLSATNMAKAFIEKGAKAYIGWQGSITLDHSDKGTLYLLQQLLIKKQTIYNSLKNTMREIGPDPLFDIPLFYYPEDMKDEVILRNSRSINLGTSDSQTIKYPEIKV